MIQKEYLKKYESELITPAEAAKWKRGASNAGWTRIRQRITGARMLPALSEDACDGVARLALKSLPGPSGRRN